MESLPLSDSAEGVLKRDCRLCVIWEGSHGTWHWIGVLMGVLGWSMKED